MTPPLQSLPYCNTNARPLRNIRPPTDPPFYAIHHTILVMTISCKGQLIHSCACACACVGFQSKLAALSTLPTASRQSTTTCARYATTPSLVMVQVGDSTLPFTPFSFVAPPSSVVKCLWEAFVWGFGVLFLPCVCVSVSGVLFSVGVCVCVTC